MTESTFVRFKGYSLDKTLPALLMLSCGFWIVPQLAFAISQSQATASQTTKASTESGALDLIPEKAIHRALAGTETHSYHMALASGQRTNIIVEQLGIDVVIQVIDSNNVIAEIDSEARPQGREHFVLVADSAVLYELKVKAKYPRYGSGDYEIKAATPQPATEQDHAAFAAYKLITQADALGDAGKYVDAIKLAQRALESGEKGLGPDNAFIGELAMHLGGMQQTKGDFANAEKVLLRAVSISEKSLGQHNPQTGLAVFHLALVYRSIDDDAKAEKYLQQALETLEKTLGDDHPTVATCLAQISLLHQVRGDFQTATAELQRAIAIAQKSLEPTDSLSLTLFHNLGNLYLDQNNYDQAESIGEQELKLVEQKYGPDHPRVALALQNLGSIARTKHQYSRALEFLWRAEKIREKTLGLQHPQTGSLFINIGNVYRDQNDYAKAIEFYHKALDILETSAGPYHDLTLMALSNLADASTNSGDAAHAVEYQAQTEKVVEKKIELNLAVGSERQMLTYSDWMANRTDRTISMHVLRAPNDPVAQELAAMAVLQRQGRVLDALSGTSAALRQRLKPQDQKLLDELADKDAELARVALTVPGKTSPEEYKKKLAALEEQREKLEAEVTRSSAGYFEQTDPVTLPEISAAIPEHAVLIEFAVYHPYNPKGQGELYSDYFGEPHYVVYVITHQGTVKWKDLGEVKGIDQSLDALRKTLRDPGRTDVRQLARAADEKIFQPISPLLGNATQLLISPDGELGLVPVEAFIDEKGHYLVEHYSISYLTSGRDLMRMQVARQSKSGPLVIADPFFGDPVTQVAKAGTPNLKPASITRRRSITTAGDLSSVYFAPLSGTAQEAHNIQQLFPDAKIVTGRAATTSSLKQVDAPFILHIATHGFFLEDPASKTQETDKRGASSGQPKRVAIENPLLRSGLAFAGANVNKSGKDDGILTALEASNLNLWGTKLVTLSACDTGVGEVKTGEGIYGLRRAFFHAGAETLVMSLWPVSDNVTREMMTAYYTGLQQGLGRGEALHQAELAMLKKKGRQHPFFWASFIQSGDWTSLEKANKAIVQPPTN
jgi:CHAT domain-containing protein